MEDFVVTATALKLGYFALAILAAFGSLLFLMRAGSAHGRQVLNSINSTPRSASTFWAAVALGLLLMLGMLLGCAPANAGPVIPSKYDGEIKSAVGKYWPDYPFWRAWKAQLYAESRLDPKAISPAGAKGLAQFMNPTWADVARELRLGSMSPHDEIAIEAGAFYVAKLKRIWRSPRPADDRHKITVASYNAGPGSLIAAQRACGMPALYEEIARCLPSVTGRFSEETLTYVARIWKYWATLEAGG